MPAHGRMRAFDRDLIRGGHYGQRPSEPRQQAEHIYGRPRHCKSDLRVRQCGCLQSSIRSQTTLMVSAERPPIIERSRRGAMYPSGSAGPRSATELPSCFDHLRSIADLGARAPGSGSARSDGGVAPAARHQRPGDACALCRRMYPSPRFEIRPRRSLPPLDRCCGTSPSQAARESGAVHPIIDARPPTASSKRRGIR